jgi:hypothetical protein
MVYYDIAYTCSDDNTTSFSSLFLKNNNAPSASRSISQASLFVAAAHSKKSQWVSLQYDDIRHGGLGDGEGMAVKMIHA